MVNHRVAGLFSHHSQHVSWTNVAGDNFFLIALMYPVNEMPIPFLSYVKVVTERAIDKRVNGIPKPDEKLEMKMFHQQWQDILRADALEALYRVIPVFKKF